jgi:hypothetical protein
MSEASRLVEQGIAAARADRKEEAEELLNRAVAIDPENEQAWLWLSVVVEGIEPRRHCLRKVIQINPANPFARSGLRFLSHLREGHEYMAARAPWMATVESEEDRATPAKVPPRRCPQCGAINPGWAYICDGCTALLEPADAAEAARRQVARASQPPPSLLRPWASAMVLDGTSAFAPEVDLASPLRAVLSIALGTLALNVLRMAGTATILSFFATRRPPRLLADLGTAFLSDQASLTAGALLAWVLLAVATHAMAHSMGGLGSWRIHSYLVAVAVSAWMPVAGIVGLVWWLAALLIPGVSVELLAALAGGLLFFYALTLVTQAIHTTHGLQPMQEVTGVGLLLVVSTVAYAGLTAVSPAALRGPLASLVEVLFLPLWP